MSIDTPDHRSANGALEPRQARSVQTRRRLLDAAVEELIDSGYSGITTAKVAQRAGVSRGAQQHHFPHKQTLVAEAISHLAVLALEALYESAGGGGRNRTRRVLDRFYELYTGPLFTAMLELTLAARSDAHLAELVTPVDRELSLAIHAQAGDLFGEAATARDFDLRFRHALSTIRGLAVLQILGHPGNTESQWRFTRAELVRMLAAAG